MSDVNLKPLFKYLDEKFKASDKEIKSVKEGLHILTDAVDAYLKQGETYRQEVLSMRLTLDRHERWFKLIERKIGIKLEA